MHAKRAKLSVWVVLATTGCALMLALWALEPEPCQVQLRDGSILRLERVRYKPKAAPTPWQRAFEQGREWIGQRLRQTIFNDRFAPPDSLVFWISRVDKTGKALPMREAWTAVAVDQHGCEFTVPGMDFSAGRLHPLGASLTLRGAALPVFPRREPEFVIRLLEQGQVAAEFKTRNPAPRQYPVWRPERLPITRTLGGANVTLHAFDNVFGPSPFDPFQRRQFTLTPDFQLPPDWELHEISVEDATGNSATPDWPPQFGPPSKAMRRHRPWEPLSAQFRFCTNETAWKLAASFRRKVDADFGPSEIWHIPDLAVPPAGTLRPLNQSNSWQGVTVVLKAIAGPAEILYSNGVPIQVSEFKPPTRVNRFGPPFGPGPPRIPVASDKPQLLVEVSGLEDLSELQVLAKTSVKSGPCAQRLRSNRHLVIGLDSAEDAASIDLTFIIQRPQIVEFFVEPKARVDDSPAGGMRPFLVPRPRALERPPVRP